jgi:hypothetical protein
MLGQFDQRLGDCLGVRFDLVMGDDLEPASIPRDVGAFDDVAAVGVWVGAFGTMRMSALSHDVLLSPTHAQDDTMCCF